MKTKVLGSILATLLFAAPAGAHTGPGATSVQWEALPCAVACSYWIDNGFTPCSQPFPPGTYDDVLTVPAPARDAGKIVVLQASIDPTIDWDLFLCSPGGDEKAYACGGGAECSTAGPVCYYGCHEDVSAPVAAGEQMVLRAYNWSDAFPATGAYWFKEI
jgi:hypothetical protein